MAVDATIQLKNDISCLKGFLGSSIRQQGGTIECITFSLNDCKKEGDTITSPSFYSSIFHGYLMAVEFHDEDNNYTSVNLKILEGRYDAELKWPLLEMSPFHC